MREAPYRSRVSFVSRSTAFLVLAALSLGYSGAAEGAQKFRRGDSNADGKVDLSDGIAIFGYLFLGSGDLSCLDAADTNDDGKIDLSDGIADLNFLFLGAADPPAPGPYDCGVDATSGDALGCDSYDLPGCTDVVNTPPSTPTGLVAIAANGQVSLDWASNVEPDIAGYNVYRSTTQGSGHVKVNGALVVPSAYLDTSVANGTKYYYRVSAVDTGSLESALSGEASATPIAPSGDDPVQIGHVLNRIGYGPRDQDIQHIEQIGLTAYIQEQLNPGSIDESTNAVLKAREASHFTTYQPANDSTLLEKGSLWLYLKGTAAPPSDWNKPTFTGEATWTRGALGIGYGDGDDVTVLGDMQNNYASVFLRTTFEVADPSAIGTFIANVDYDDGFVLYLNGQEVARKGLTGNPPAFNALAASHDAGTPEDIDLSSHKPKLVAGTNLLAAQVHNTALNSSDLSFNISLINRKPSNEPPVTLIKGKMDLHELLMDRAVYSDRQLETVMTDFWMNHFTQDTDKLEDIISKIPDSNAARNISQTQASQEAAQISYEQMEKIREMALGNFGDLLLYSVVNVGQILYLDAYLSVVGTPNENLPREILELYGFGVDNRYVQKDVEQFALCYTGWNVCKVLRADAQPFPLLQENPPTTCGVQYTDTVVLSNAGSWKYLKGTAEPTPDGTGAPTTAWAQPGFAETGWATGSTTTTKGIGYGDDDDAVVLSDMQGSYVSYYMRRTFNVPDLAALTNPILEVRYDDSFVVYLNGVEVARSDNLNGSPPPYDRLATLGHEVGESVFISNLRGHIGALKQGSNVLAIQVHNIAKDSSDASMIVTLKQRDIIPNSGIEPSYKGGVWVPMFTPALHDTKAKTLFAAPNTINIPAGRTGLNGTRDVLDVVEKMVDNPSSAEFICIKLIQRFVSDDISIQNKTTAPAYLRSLLADCIAAWNSTTPKGNIKKVMEVILDPVDRQSAFWAPSTFRNKVRNPNEINAAIARALEASIAGNRLADLDVSMDMILFQRDEPNGFAEAPDLYSTANKRRAINFARGLATNTDGQATWNTLKYCDDRGLDTAQEIVDHFTNVLFQGTLSSAEKAKLVEFLTTDDNYNPKPLSRASSTAFKSSVEALVGLLLSHPLFDFQ